jgi:hypothetical protein
MDPARFRNWRLRKTRTEMAIAHNQIGTPINARIAQIIIHDQTSRAGKPHHPHWMIDSTSSCRDDGSPGL